MNYIYPIVFEILKFKFDRLTAFLHLTGESYFSQISGFNKIIKVIMVHDLNPNNLHINGLVFFCKIQKTLFFGIFGHYPKSEIFSKKIWLRQFFTFKGILYLINCFGENAFTYWPTDLLTSWHTGSGEIRGPLLP